MFKVKDLGFEGLGFRVKGSGSRVLDPGFWVLGFGFWGFVVGVSGLGFRKFRFGLGV
jgi:hypothetical protein